MKYKINDVNEVDFIHSVLENRGVKEIDRFLDAKEDCVLSAELLDNLHHGGEMLKRHLDQKDKVNVVVDDDGDGFMSSALLYFFFKDIGYPQDQVTFLLHERKYHGIEVDKVSEDCKLLICPDCGSSDYEQHATLGERGVEVLVLDHHEFADSPFPQTNTVIINNQSSPNYPNKGLCGTGVTYKFLEWYCRTYSMDCDMSQYMDLLAVALIGDVMSIAELENRYYVKKGLSQIRNSFLETLVDKRAYMVNKGAITPTDVAFYLVPAINAIIRVGEYIEKKVVFSAICDGDRLLSSTKRGHENGEMEKAKDQAVRICDNAINKQRRERKNFLDSAIAVFGEQPQDKIIVYQVPPSNSLNRNITGLAAMELANYYKRPAIVLFRDEQGWSGSGRNYGTALSDLKAFLNGSGCVEYASGHPNAFGCGFSNDGVEQFRGYCKLHLVDVDYSDNSYHVDFCGSSNNPNLKKIVSEIDKWKELWGQCVQEPLMCIKNVAVNGLTIMGKAGDCAKFVRDGITFVRFKDLDYIDSLDGKEDMFITVIGKANVNVWNGVKTPQILIQDYQIEDNYSF